MEERSGRSPESDFGVPSSAPRCELNLLGLVPYKQAWDLQAELVRARKAGEIADQLLLLEHPHVYTVGRRGGLSHILLDGEGLSRLGIELFEVDRGGDVTYHGPGQLVGYPIVDLRRQGVDAHRYLRGLEESLIKALADYGVAAGRNPGFTGVWLGNDKIAAIGVRISGGVTSHGFALNVNTDLSYFTHIVPCGLVGKGVTSLQRVLGRPVPLAEVAGRVAGHFAEEFGLDLAPAERNLLQMKKREGSNEPEGQESGHTGGESVRRQGAVVPLDSNARGGGRGAGGSPGQGRHLQEQERA